MLIGLTGPKGSGKDTAAAALASRGYEVFKFAAPLKEMLSSLLRYQGADDKTIYRMIEGDLKEEPSPLLQDKTPRHAMQTLGTEWGRTLIGQRLWTDALSNAIADKKNVVVTDVRFFNEARTINELGGRIVRITRPSNSTNVYSLHLSELEMQSIRVDASLYNGGSVEDLQDQMLMVETALQTLQVTVR